MPNVLEQLNRLLGLLGTVGPAAAASAPDIITPLNQLLELLNVASTSRLSASDATIANELYKQLQGLLALLLSVQPRTAPGAAPGTEVLDTLERLSRLLQEVRTKVVTQPLTIDAVAALEQLSQMRRLLEWLEPTQPVPTAAAQALLTQLDGLQRLIGLAAVSRIQGQLGQVTDPAQTVGMLNELQRLVGLLRGAEGVSLPAPAPKPELETEGEKEGAAGTGAAGTGAAGTGLPIEDAPEPVQQFSHDMITNIHSLGVVNIDRENAIQQYATNISGYIKSIIKIFDILNRKRTTLNQNIRTTAEQLAEYNNISKFNSINDLKTIIIRLLKFTRDLQKATSNNKYKQTLSQYENLIKDNQTLITGITRS